MRSEDGPQDDLIFMGRVQRRKQKNWEEIGVKSRVDRPEKAVTNWVKCRQVAAPTQWQTNTWKVCEEDFTGLCKWDWGGPRTHSQLWVSICLNISVSKQAKPCPSTLTNEYLSSVFRG